MATRDDEGQRQRMDCATRPVRELFHRLPALAGFCLRTDLTVADVSVTASSKGASTQRLHLSLMRAVVELAECNPEAVELMRGRTFARPR